MHPATLAAVFVLRGSAHVDVAPLPAGDHPSEMRVTITPAARPDLVSVKLESTGHACTFEARRSRDGVLEFSTPATCAVDVSRREARGHIDAQLRSGRGTIRGDRLTLDLRFDVSGRMATRIPRTSMNVLGAEFVVPEGWTPSAPVRGTVTSHASGSQQAR
jgi:hypothetical protein